MKKLLLVALIVTFSMGLASAQTNKAIFGARNGDVAEDLILTNGAPFELELWMRTDPSNPGPLVGVAHGLQMEDQYIAGGTADPIFNPVPEYDVPNWEQAFVDGPYTYENSEGLPCRPAEGFTVYMQGALWSVFGTPPGDPIDTQGDWIVYGHWHLMMNTGIPTDQTVCPFTDGVYPHSCQGTAWSWEGGGTNPETEFSCIYISANTDPEFTVCPEGGCADAGIGVCFDVAGTDLDGLDNLHITLFSGPGYFTEAEGGPGGVASGTWCWDDPMAGDYTVVLELNDNAGGTDYCEFTLSVSAITFEIDCVPGFPGASVIVPVRLHTCSFLTGGIEFLAEWDPTVLDLTGVEPASRIDMGNEYFYWDEGDPCDPPCDEGGAVRVTWISDINNGIPHDPAGPGSDPVFFLEFDINPDVPWGMTIDINFLNQHYSDNTISDPSGYIWWTPEQIPGCVEVMDPGSFKGDPNWNGWFFEIGDAVLVARRLIHGPIVWEEDGTWNDAYQEAAADLNNNGFADVADLVMFINIINDIIPPPYKLEPGSATAEVSMSEVIGDEVEVMVSSELDVGAVLVSIDHAGVELGTPVAQSGMELRYYDADGVMNVVVFSMEANVVAAGSSPLFTVPVVSNDGGSVSFGEVSSSDAYGNLLETVASLEAPLPTSYSVEQNYPNPFNARTQISFALPEAADVSIEIYSVTGQLVETISDRYEAGNHSVTWDASRVASGVYFYKLTAGDFSQTMKMTLLK
jgi:hypothetical protein